MPTWLGLRSDHPHLNSVNNLTPSSRSNNTSGTTPRSNNHNHHHLKKRKCHDSSSDLPPLKSSRTAATSSEPRKCAFSLMMEAAKKPGAFYKKQGFNPEMTVDTNGTNEENGQFEDEDTEQDPIVKKLILQICRDWDKEEDEFYDRSKLFDDVKNEDDEDDEEEEGDGDGDDSKGREEQGIAAILPAPLTKPEENAVLRSIDVMFDLTSIQKRRFFVRGFRFIYSDGSEAEVGNLFGTRSSGRLQLKPDEHVTAVVPDYDEYSKLLCRIYFFTSEDRIVVMDETNRGSLVENDDDIPQERFAVEEGSILRSIEWSIASLKINGIQTQPHPSASSSQSNDSSASSCQVPSLTSLALRAIDTKHRKQAIRLFLSKKYRLQKLSEQYKQCVNHTYECGRRALRRSPEAANVRTLRFLLNDAEHKLLQKKNSIVSHAKSQTAYLSQKFQQRRKFIHKEWRRRDSSALLEYKNYVDACISINAVDPNDQVCSRFFCRKRFSPKLVPRRKRCVVCWNKSPLCGCSVSICFRCNTSVCSDHVQEHRKMCTETLHLRCGFHKKSNVLLPSGCGQVVGPANGVKRCTVCFTQCCDQCRTSCVGRPTKRHSRHRGDRRDVRDLPNADTKTCGAVWCFECIEDLYCDRDMSMPCCDDCCFFIGDCDDDS